MKLSPEFIQTIRKNLGVRAEAWLAALPDLLANVARRWQLTLLPHFEVLSYSYVSPVTCADGTPAVLKIGVPNRELTLSIEALEFMQGDHMVRLLQADADRGVMLLEKLSPGLMLTTVVDDEQATRIACEVMQKLWKPAPAVHPFPTVADWAAGLKKIPVRYPTISPLPQAWINRAEGLFADLLPSQAAPVVLHGDLHHYNVLSGEKGWKAIDPQGVVGEPVYETGALLRNPFDLFDRPDPLKLTERRIAILGEQLGFDRQRILDWAIAQAVLSNWWTVEDGGVLTDSDFLFYEILTRIKI